MKKALILGVNGQDGSYLSELLIGRGYEVHGLIRRTSNPNTQRIDHIFDPEKRDRIHYGDLEEGIEGLLYSIKPDEVYNLAAMSHVKISFDIPVHTAMINAVGPLKVLEAIRRVGLKSTKFYQASSSEMFGDTLPPQNEKSYFNPVSPYGCAKLFAFHITKTYRSAYNMFAANGILFNHESERRGVNFVTRKITRAAVRIKKGRQKELVLGNLSALRDWGHSRDYMDAIYKIMQYGTPEDWVVATGETHSVKEFVEEVFKYLDLDFKEYVKFDSVHLRPNEVPALLGDAGKTRRLLKWEPKIRFKELVKLMVDSDMKELTGENQASA